jgi:hypothetical protein
MLGRKVDIGLYNRLTLKRRTRTKFRGASAEHQRMIDHEVQEKPALPAALLVKSWE